MFKSGKGSLGDSSLIRGVAFRRRVPMDGLPNNLQNAKVAVIGGDLKIRSMTRDAQIKIASAGQLDSFVSAEQARKEDIAAGLLATGADVILCGGEIDTEILHIPVSYTHLTLPTIYSV